MIVGQFLDQVIKELGELTVSKNLDRRNVVVRLDAEWRAVLAAGLHQGTFLKNFNGGGEFQYKIDPYFIEPADNLFISGTAPILYNESRAVYYSVVPGEFISYTSFNGIRRVKPLQANTTGAYYDAPTEFRNQRQGAGTAYGILESAQMGGAVGYEIEGQQIIYNNLPLNTYKQVLITYLPAFTGLKETDYLPVSSEFAALLMDRCKAAFGILKSDPQGKASKSDEKGEAP